MAWDGKRIRWGAHWRHLLNTIETSMCGGGLLSNYFDHTFYLYAYSDVEDAVGIVGVENAHDRIYQRRRTSSNLKHMAVAKAT